MLKVEVVGIAASNLVKPRRQHLEDYWPAQNQHAYCKPCLVPSSFRTGVLGCSTPIEKLYTIWTYMEPFLRPDLAVLLHSSSNLFCPFVACRSTHLDMNPLQTLIDRSFGANFSYQGDFRVDENVLAKFPSGTKVVMANRYATSSWTVTARIHLEMPDGSEEIYFLKSAPLALGGTMMQGEFHVMSEFHKFAPDFVPKPQSWGRYSFRDFEAYFLILEYLDMATDTMPDPTELCSKLARVHRQSKSPTGQFGFAVTTCQNLYPQDVGWESNWTTFYQKLFQHAMKLDFETNGYWEELDRVEQRVLKSVVPRLLDALVQDGRTLKPSLIHADLWEGNTGTSLENGNVYIYDSAGFYAHNELDVADWRGYFNKIHRDLYIKTYLRFFPASEPKEEWDDRNRLYACYYYVWYSVHHKASGKAVRQMQVAKQLQVMIDLR